MDRQAARQQYEAAVLTLHSLKGEAVFADFEASPTRLVELLLNCVGRIGVTMEQVDKLAIIHVAGTKGKGSTCAYVESILRHHGYKTGLFSSPHVKRVRDRIAINGQPVDESVFASAFWHVFFKLQETKMKNARMMTGFLATVVLMAMHVFIQEKVDVVVLEVGIGGECDSTNFVRQPWLCGVTSLHVEHTDLLGNTAEEIAWHKAGITKPGVPLVTVPHDPSVMNVIINRAQQKQCPVWVVSPLTLEDLKGCELGIPGAKQPINAALAVLLCRLWRQRKDQGGHTSPLLVNGVTDDLSTKTKDVHCHSITTLTEQELAGLREANIPGRSQVIKKKGITYYLDGAHTPESLKQCVEWFKEAAKKEEEETGGKFCRTLVFGMKKSKPWKDHLPFLQGCGFTRVAISTSILSTSARRRFVDAVNFSTDPEDSKQTALIQFRDWLELQTRNKDHTVLHARHFPSVASAVWWAGLDRDTPIRQLAEDDLALKSQSKGTAEHEGGTSWTKGPMGDGDVNQHVQVLVTGSLIIVGEVLLLLEETSPSL